MEYGSPVYRKVEKEFSFPWLSANILEADTGNPVFKPYTVILRDNFRIAVIGFTTLTAKKAMKYSEKDTMEVEDLTESAKKWVELVKNRENPDIIIGLFHEGLEKVLPVIEKVSGFDIVFTGHDHQEHNVTVFCREGKEVVVTGAKERGMSLAYAEITFKRKKKKIKSSVIQLADTAPDKRFIEKGTRHRELASQYSREVRAVTDTVIKTAGDNSVYMDILHNTLLKLTDSEISITAPVARDYKVEPGEITNGDLFNLYPFLNYPVVLKMSGKEIKALLSYSQKIQEENHPRKRFYNNLSMKPLSIDDLIKERAYKVVMNSYHGMNGGNMISEGTGISETELKKRIIKVYDENIREHLFQ
jgi:2',3'-cyclic-nucleotide 2'-phosphodiesterase / 3'-nucleotidase